MTDEQLLKLLEEKTPEELTLQELDYLKQRLADSAPLREALLGQLQMESYLTAALGRIQLSPQAIVAKAQKEQSRGWGVGVSLLVLLICLPVIGLTGAVLYNAVVGAGDEPDATIAANETPGSENEDQSESGKTPDNALASSTSENAAQGVDGSAASPSSDQPKAATPAETPAEQKPERSQSNASPKAPLPWAETFAAAPQPFQAVAFTTFDLDKRLPRQTDLQAWFEAAPGSNFRLHEMDTRKGRCGAIEGIGRLKAPWTDDSVLRIALEHYNKLQLHFYHGNVGVTLVYYEDQGNRWVAYATTRAGKGTAKPETVAAAATDDERCRRTEIRHGGPLDLRWRDGELILSRGDIVLLAAPLPGLPDDVYFEGRAAIQGISLVRTTDNPPSLTDRPIVYDTPSPSELLWTLRPNPGRQPNDPQPTIEKLSGGAIRLAGDQLKHGADISTPLPKNGLYEVVLELDNITPGVSVFLGRDEGHPEHVLRFFRNRRDNRTFARITWISDESEAETDTYNSKPEAVVGDRCWVKFLYGCGNLRWLLSTDGKHWAQIDHAQDGAKGNLSTIGLHVVAKRPTTEITLKRVQLRELKSLSALADASLIEKGVAPVKANNLGQWTFEVLRQLPPNVAADDWLRACAIRSLGRGCENTLANDLLEALLDGKKFQALPVDDQLASLSDAMLLAWDLRDGGAMTVGLPTRFLRVGVDAYDKHGQNAWPAVRRASMSAPSLTWMQGNPPTENAIRWEMIAAINDQSPEQTLDACRQLRFYHQRQVSPLIDWAEATAQRESTLRGNSQSIAAMKEGWRHPLVEDLSKETYNLLSELQAVLDSQSWEDAARLVTSLDPESAPGLAPYARDRRLLVSLPTAVRLMLNDYPQVQTSLAEDFAPLAGLRLNRAMAGGDWSEVELAAVQFASASEAAAAHRWLGDRALASGWFERAITEYTQAEAIQPSLTAELAPRRRLAAAMLGKDAGQPATTPVSFGDMQLDAAQFEALISEMRARGSTGVSQSDAVIAAAASEVPPPATFTAAQRSRLDGPTGDKPHEEVGRRTNQFRVPWPDRQLSVVKEGDVMYVANRFQVAAYRLSDGQRIWQSETPPGQMQRSQHFALIEMRPLISSQHIYVRMLYGDNPLLVCLNKNDGKTVWTTKLSDKEFFVSDPLVVRGQLGLFSIQLQEGQEGLLRWNVVDTGSGEVQSQRDLLRLRSTWGTRACCEVAHVDDNVVAMLGGMTISVDPLGQLRWVRKHVVVPADEDPRWILQRYQPPIVEGDRLYLAQPGVRAIECVDSMSGAQRWSVTLPDLLSIVAKSGQLLIVRTERDFRALDASTGKTRWRHAAENVHPWQIVGNESLLYASWEKTPGDENKLRTRLNWIDISTGRRLGSSVVEQLADTDPKLGPLLSHQGRLWTFFGKGQHEPTRDVVELTASGPAEMPADSQLVAWQSVPFPIAAAASKLLPNWNLLVALPGENTGELADVHGEKKVVATRSQGNLPTIWARPIDLPEGSKRRLRIRVGCDAGMEMTLQVHLGAEQIHEVVLKDETHPSRWKDLEVDLSPSAGKAGWLTVSAAHTAGSPSSIYWKTLEVVD